MTTTDFTETYLLYVVLPLWLVSGLADWLCHRASSIETTSGPKESFIHLLMLSEAAIPILLALFLQINGLVILVMVAAWLLHELTSTWDISYAYRTRTVTPIEQRIHDYLGAIPFMALSFVLVLHWPQLLALFGAGPEPLSLAIEWKQTPLPMGYIVGLLTAILLLDVLPYLEEFSRTLRVWASRQSSKAATRR